MSRTSVKNQNVTYITHRIDNIVFKHPVTLIYSSHTILYFKLGHIAFICDRRSGTYHTMKQFLQRNT
jgi:hypothetical protein